MASKRIIICCDGTWHVSEPDDGTPPTNVVKLSRAITPRGTDGVVQRVYYAAGIGTAGRFDWWVRGHTGIGLSSKVLDAYRFLLEHWAEGDEVYLFGFSRGAFTVRSLARFLGLTGLIGEDELPAAWKLFEQAQLGNRGRHLPVKMIGVWDAVDALGLPVPLLRQLTLPRLRFHDARLGPHVANGFHAIAIDEIRSAFRPTLWDNDAAPGQRIEQVWFSGSHADCGGGYQEHGLSDLALNWMLRRAEECGLQFNSGYEHREIQPDPKQPMHVERNGLHGILPLYRRPILETNRLNERVHWSAATRLEDPAAGYSPENLRRALDAHGRAVVTDPSEDRAD